MWEIGIVTFEEVNSISEKMSVVKLIHQVNEQ